MFHSLATKLFKMPSDLWYQKCLVFEGMAKGLDSE